LDPVALWQVSTALASFCTDAVFLTSVLCTAEILVPFTDDNDIAEKLCEVCEMYGLPKVAMLVCRRAGMKKLRIGQLGDAMHWILRTGDQVLIVNIADLALDRHMDTGDAEQVEAVA
jgi:hypothetical protein